MAIIDLHHRVLTVAGAVVARVRSTDLARPTPCAGWDLAALLGHMVGQNHGFAEAVEAGSAPRSAYAPRPAGWPASADRLTSAFATAPPDRVVLLVEISEELRFPVPVVAGFHLLDTVVHTWDVATALGEPFRPDDELVAATLAQARLVPAGAARVRPGAAFAPVLPAAGDDWEQALALLGRDPHGRLAA